MARDDVKPVYVIHGPDAYLGDRHVQGITARVVAEADPQMAIARFDGSAALADVLDELRTPPLLAPRRVVIVRDADAFVSASRDALERYLEAPSANGVLVLRVGSWRKNTRLDKQIQQVGEVLSCETPTGSELSQWIAGAARQRGKTLDRDAAELLAHWVGGDLATVVGEIEKLATYVGDADRITVQDVSALVVSTAGTDPFALANAIIEGNTAAALKVLEASLARRGDEFKTLGLLAWHLRRATKAKELCESGMPPAEACKQVKVFYRQQQAFIAMLRKRSLRKLQRDFRALMRADLAMKSGTSPTSAMRDLVVQLCN